MAFMPAKRILEHVAISIETVTSARNFKGGLAYHTFEKEVVKGEGERDVKGEE
jgi:hypothetical protein